MNNISSCLLIWCNNKGYYSQSYGNNNKMPEIAIVVENCGGQKNHNVMICFLNMIREGVFFGMATLNLYIKVHTQNYCDRAFNSPKVLYRK